MVKSMDTNYLKRFDTPENILAYLEETLSGNPASYFKGSITGEGGTRITSDNSMIMYPMINYFGSGNFQEALTLLEQSEKFKGDERAKELIANARRRSLGIVNRLKQIDGELTDKRMNKERAISIITSDLNTEFQQMLREINTLRGIN